MTIILEIATHSNNHCNLCLSVSGHASYQTNISGLLPHTSTTLDYLKPSLESTKSTTTDLTFTDVSRKPSSAFSAFPASDRTSKVARITELSHTIQSRLREPMQELERHLECKDASFYCCVCNEFDRYIECKVAGFCLYVCRELGRHLECRVLGFCCCVCLELERHFECKFSGFHCCACYWSVVYLLWTAINVMSLVSVFACLSRIKGGATVL